MVGLAGNFVNLGYLANNTNQSKLHINLGYLNCALLPIVHSWN